MAGDWFGDWFDDEAGQKRGNCGLFGWSYTVDLCDVP